MRHNETYLGDVKRVKGAEVLVELSSSLPSSTPIIRGRIHRLGQVGSFVRIPVGIQNLYGVVSMVGSSEVFDIDDKLSPGIGGKWLQVQLIGESYKNKIFERGVSVYPTIDDEVHVVTEQDLRSLYSATSSSNVKIGSLVSSESLPAFIDLDKLVNRHAAIIGSTGSGKSNTVASILKAIASDEYPNARILVIDPHGEYGSAFHEIAKVFSVGEAGGDLRVPFWALSMEELLWFLVDKKTSSDTMQDTMLLDYIYNKKIENSDHVKSMKVNRDRITVNSPIPFSLRSLWYYFDRNERVTYDDSDRKVEALLEEGDEKVLKSAVFKPAALGSKAPFKPQTAPIMGSYVKKIYGKLGDKRYDFLLDSKKYDGVVEDLDDLMKSWIGHNKPITVLDLGGVPSDITDLIVGVIVRLIYEFFFWGRNINGVGKDRPLLLIMEEAHTYLPRGKEANFVAGYASRSMRKVLKEGRKYGIGAIMVSQRPSELDETVLSQCGTFISLRLSNPDDQSRVKSTIPDSISSLLELLPSLRTGEAVVTGEAVRIPSRIRVPLIEPRPDSVDPPVAIAWKQERNLDANYSLAVKAWRDQDRKTTDKK